MSQQEINRLFEIERRKHLEFYLPYYRDRNWQVVEDRSGTKFDWDVKLEIRANTFVTVDEKALMKEWNDCLVEIIQDVITYNPGWFYKKKDWILYGSWDDPERDYPSSLYVIYFPRLQGFVHEMRGSVKSIIAPGGWGITYNIVLEWDDLIKANVAKRLL